MERKLLVNPDDPMPMSIEEVLERIGRELDGAEEPIAWERPTSRGGRLADVAQDFCERSGKRLTGAGITMSDHGKDDSTVGVPDAASASS